MRWPEAEGVGKRDGRWCGRFAFPHFLPVFAKPIAIPHAGDTIVELAAVVAWRAAGRLGTLIAAHEIREFGPNEAKVVLFEEL